MMILHLNLLIMQIKCNSMFRFILIMGGLFFCCDHAFCLESGLQDKIKGISSNAVVVILSPGLKFESVMDESSIDPALFDSQKLDSLCIAEAEKAVIKNNPQLRIIDNGNATHTAYEVLLLSLKPFSGQLAAGKVNQDALSVFRKISALNNESFILAHDVYAKVGPGGYWNPGTGGIASTSSISRYRIALIRCLTGDVVWKSEEYIRQVPSCKSLKFVGFIKFPYGESNQK